MKWIQIDNSARDQPKIGTWHTWKPHVAKACKNKCVYCAIPDSRYGGLDNFHIDHFRPKSIGRFKRYENVITNLYLSCAICNRFKSNDWPNDPVVKMDIPCYPDPSQVHYQNIFSLRRKDFVLTGVNAASRYVLERLYLNRPQLIRQRRIAHVEEELERVRKAGEAIFADIKKTGASIAIVTLLSEMLEAQTRAYDSYIRALTSSPYQLSEIKRPRSQRAKKLDKPPKPRR